MGGVASSLSARVAAATTTKERCARRRWHTVHCDGETRATPEFLERLAADAASRRLAGVWVPCHAYDDDVVNALARACGGVHKLAFVF